MTEYIEREAALEESVELYYWCGYEDRYGYFVPVDAIQCIHAADVAPVRHGQWISFLDGDHIMPERYYRCSRCGRVESSRQPYCHCGAKMDGGSD